MPRLARFSLLAMTRRQLLQLAAASGAVSLVPAVLRSSATAAPSVPGTLPQKPGKSLSFLVFGDWGSGLKLQKDVAAGMTRFARENKPHFVISVGDNFYDNGVVDQNDPQWDTKFETMYPKDAMPFPFFAVLGNHDWRSNPATQFSYRGPSGRWRMDGFYYKVVAGDGLVDFFMVDTNLWLPKNGATGLGDKQTKWLDGALSQSTAKWKILVGHHPPYTDGIHASEPDMELVRGILSPLLDKYGVQLMLAGHDHDLQHIIVPDAKTHFTVTGAGGASMRKRYSNNYGPFYKDLTGGFMNIAVSETELKARYLSSELDVLHEWMQTLGV
ncbi:3',5'-cyclic adenosine monophosphate phosphodiesterase CpdA [Abditibacteriota bacterium]|nr:3',5'-cyclic adenosine monophosphate phosphodiesterase CpdA [Abditibacteriota bacterium]